MNIVRNLEYKTPSRFDPWPLVGGLICVASAAGSGAVLWFLWKCLRGDW